MSSKQIRQQFLDFFATKGHAIVPSAPIVIKNDPTLLFTNAGMNQFKDLFLGNAEAKDKRVTDTQKCLRVSGKHNDLEEVGHDTYHHTMFEMLGNWSFGDYFKEEAIAWAWELLTEVYGIDKDLLYVSVFSGDKEDGLEEDKEAYDFWKKWISEDRILKCDKKDNFWEMGDQGPCGPCSEIHVDLRNPEDKAKVDGKTLVNEDHPQVVEIWNLVFMQFNRSANGSLSNLPSTHVDTGMGFERLCMVLQGKQSNYDTDVFQPIIQTIAKIAGKRYGDIEANDIAMRVISDHIRAVIFTIADGQIPGNSGSGYVVKRILRRAIRYGYSYLDIKEPFMYKLVQIVTDQLGEAFPETLAQKELIEKVIHEEEVNFLRTLENGLKRIDTIAADPKHQQDGLVNGRAIFELYDTYGFPVDLTRLIAKEKGLEIDEAGFECELDAQKKRSKADAAHAVDDWVLLREDDIEEFIGYDNTEADLKVTRHRKVESKGKTQYQLVFNYTPFYAESGGQVGDVGYIEAGGVKYSIKDTQRENNLIIHYTDKLPTNPEVTFKAVVNKGKRQLIMLNHTATHLLHEALREVLGSHVEQKGSLVNDKHLRFDFSHFSKMSDEEIEQVENIVNANIRADHHLIEDRTVPMQKALDMGATALFGEKYGEVVRVIKFGESIELCGGTHAQATGNIGLFKIISESSVAAGIRRVEAITGPTALDFLNEKKHQLSKSKR